MAVANMTLRPKLNGRSWMLSWRITSWILIAFGVAACSFGTNSPGSNCPASIDAIEIHSFDQAPASIGVPRGWDARLALGDQSRVLSISDSPRQPVIEISIGRYEATMDDDLALELLRADGVVVGESELTLKGGQRQLATVVETTELGVARRVLEAFTPDEHGKIRQVSASTPLEYADACRPQIAALLETVDFQ